MRQYRAMFALPGVRALMTVMFFARVPVTAAPMVLTLHVVEGLGRGYGAAGLVGAAATVGIAIGSPVVGRVVDRYGLRRMLVVVTVGETLFWATARFLPFPGLLACAFLGGIVMVPVMSIGRQAIAALVREELRRSAYSVDSVSVELTYMIGPAAAVALVTQVSTVAALSAMAVAVGVVGLALFAMNPRMRAADEDAEPKVPRREWLTPRMVGVLAIGAGAVFVLAGMEVTALATLRESGQLNWTGAVYAAICLASAIGGLVHGAVRRSLPQLTLMVLLSALVIPAGLIGDAWWVLALALVPSSLVCAPTVAATGEEVARLAPAGSRGEATGLQSSAFTLGAAAGAPVAGFVVDHTAPAAGFVVAGMGGLLVAAVAFALSRSRSLAPAPA
ncbi:MULTISPECIES: MFS transporter [Actinokineospora]|uniref:MFS transporter n=1 Tax=Actinokineospora fastidiosa TaxID=1816 RepID=A0A918G495_9PSEU|nr:MULTISPECIES: MFS transporter [Actinokineospora]UVS76557.1 H+ Antiporter protein [Actinokineospora sp. UTMC 2448]GGS17374.1 MFS transporter [Actinokineospora fastidiosa]